MKRTVYWFILRTYKKTIMNNTTNLFEYQNREKLPVDNESFKNFLNEIWKSRITESLIKDKDSGFYQQRSEQQKFISFQEDNYFKCQNYVGVIKYQDQTINLLPKIFYIKDKLYSSKEIQAIHNHILWWLSYCNKFKFPKSVLSLSYQKSNLFEVLVYLFARFTRDLFSTTLYQSFEEVSNENRFMKGRMDIGPYSKNISKGRWQVLSCTYDSFEYDTLFNRIVKYVTKLLLMNTENLENKNLLREVLFILEDVEDINATYEDCARVNVNPMFNEMNIVMDYCKIFLKNSVIQYFNNQIRVFAFLLPMEYIFEDFIYGFIDNNFPELNAKQQESSEFLAKVNGRNIFQMKHDIIIKVNDEPVIIDTKYKIVYPNMEYEDVKFGVAQSDIYQMISYAVRRNAKDIKMFYPGTLTESAYEQNELQFEVIDKFSDTKILISVIKLPIIKSDWSNFSPELKLENNFAEAEDKLKERIRGSLHFIV